MDKIINIDQIKLAGSASVIVAIVIAISSAYGDYSKMSIKVDQTSVQVSEVKQDIKDMKKDISDMKIVIAQISEAVKKKAE